MDPSRIAKVEIIAAKLRQVVVHELKVPSIVGRKKKKKVDKRVKSLGMNFAATRKKVRIFLLFS